MSLNKRKETEDLKQHIRMYRGDRLKKEKKKNPDYRTLARYILGSTPSQARELTMKDSMGKVRKIEAYEELDEMQLGARMILEIGTFIHVPTDVTNCACVHLYAFYKENSITDYDYHFVAVACLFMACKTEDHPRALNDIVIAAYNCWNDKNCQHIKKRRQYLEQKLHELKTNLTKSSGTNIPGYPCGKSPNTNFETDSPHSYKSPGNSSSIGTPNSDFKSPASTSTLLTPQPTTPDESGSFIGASPRSPRDHYNYYNRGNLHGAAKMEIQKLKNEIQRTEKELKTMPLVRYLNPNNKKEFVIPPDDFFHQTKPKIEQHELELLSSIGFSTIVSLPHILIVDSKRKFQALYGECTVSKLERIVYVAYTLATRVISLFPVQKPRNHIAAALVYLCGPFTHPVEGKEWWKEIYGADMTEIELIQLSELICDAWTSSRDWFNQVHEKKRYFEPFWRKNTEYELNKPHAELSKPGMAVSKYDNMKQKYANHPSPSNRSMMSTDSINDSPQLQQTPSPLSTDSFASERSYGSYVKKPYVHSRVADIQQNLSKSSFNDSQQIRYPRNNQYPDARNSKNFNQNHQVHRQINFGSQGSNQMANINNTRKRRFPEIHPN